MLQKLHIQEKDTIAEINAADQSRHKNDQNNQSCLHVYHISNNEKRTVLRYAASKQL